MAHLSFNSLIGPLTLFEEAGALIALDWGRAPDGGTTPLLARGRAQLDEYFAGRRKVFDLPLNPAGTAFQHAVWDVMRTIPHGTVRTYADIAAEIGSAPRAVGSASGRNPLPILIPCHRVVGKNGSLTGYSAGDGIATKARLLALEGLPTTVTTA